MAINKCQGLYSEDSGSLMEEPVFTYGQLYVVTFRVGNPSHLHRAINRSSDKKKENVINREILNN